MSIQAILSMVAGSVAGVAEFNRNRARAQRYAEVTAYIRGMPDYLRRDIGLTQDVCLVAAVEQGLTCALPDHEPRRDLIMTPHAA